MLKKAKRLFQFVQCLSLFLTLAVALGSGAAVGDMLVNGRNDQLTLISNDRSGGAIQIVNGRGDMAEIIIPWYEAITTSNSRGDVLEIGTDGFVPSSNATYWQLY